MTSSPQLQSPLKKKFFLRGFILILVFFVSSAFILYTQFLTRKLKQEDNRISQAVQVVGELDSATLANSLLLHNYAERQESQDLLDIKVNRQHADEALQKLKTLLISSDTLQKLTIYEEILPIQRQINDRIITLTNQKNSASAISDLHTQRESFDIQTRKLLREIAVIEKEELAEIIAQDAQVQSLIFRGTLILLSIDLLVVIILMITTYHMLLPPILTLTQLAAAIKEGHYSQTNPVHTRDELSFLGQIITDMSQEIAKRSASLEDSNRELKKLNDAMVGRELKMISLKEELAKFKSPSS